MATSPPSNTDSLYRQFTQKPINRSPFDVPITITDRNGTLIHEQEGQELLYTIVTHNDVEFLERYFAIDPRAIPNLFQLPDGDEAICDFGDWFRFAAESGSLGTLQTLLAYTTKGLDKTKPIRLMRANFQLLNVAAQFGHIEIVQWLLDTQPLYASIHDRDFRGFTALAAAADLFSFAYYLSPPWNEICYENNKAVINLLLDHGACASDVVHPTNDKGQKRPSVLTLAAQWASTDLLERLIDGGADVHYKVAAGSWDLGFGSQRDLPVEVEVTALFLASFRANPSGVKTLVDRRNDGVSITGMVCSPDCVGSLPLHWAARNQLPDAPSAIPALMLHERAGNITRTIEQLLDFAPTTVNTQDNDGNTALHYATQYFGKNGKMYTPIFELLCSRGADAALRNYKDETPLHTLFQSYNDDAPIDPVTVSLLLTHGAKTTDVDDAGNTPLHAACSSVKFGSDAISLLLQYGADPVLRNSKQDTPIHTIAYFRCPRDKSRSEADELMRAQDDILDTVVKAGGAQLMDLQNGAGKSARQIYDDSRAEWLDGARGK
ncbi:ankyrin protein [Fusarium subglutinans]|uniref:Ankyrin protein n=1 Tax=Gibberella subglutinans TaxID=42677 RepID=A0A8H5PUI6_GIBSU|nr:ankyrin protein [Fusarium subglutinans]KAF5602848.1 ankyrin protein [Fusarium subglutinans]